MKKVAVVLGGTVPHIQLIKELKVRDYYVVLIDYLENPSAKRYADEHIRRSTLNKEEVLSIAKKLKAALVISTCIDQANSVACYVAEQLGLPCPYSYKTSLDVTNKKLMKAIFKKYDIPTANYYTVGKLEDVKMEMLNYPVVVKPVDCNSSKGVHRADDDKSVLFFVRRALELSREKTAIIEEFKEGIEIQVDCFVDIYGNVQVLMTRDKRQQTNKTNKVLNSIGSYIPSQNINSLVLSVEEIAKRIANAFGLKNTMFFYQAIVKNENIHVLEFAPRIGGGLSSYLLEMYTGVDVIKAAVDSWENNLVKMKILKKNQIFSTTLLYTKGGRIQSILGLDKLSEWENIVYTIVYKTAGTNLDTEMSSGNRVAAYVSVADNIDQITKINKSALEMIKVMNDDGEDILLRDIYT